MKIEEIQIERYTPEVVQFYKNDGTLLGEVLNEHEFNKLRYKIVENYLTGECYFMWKDIKITLDEKGNMSVFPRNLYDIVQQDLFKLFELNKNRKQ